MSRLHARAVLDYPFDAPATDGSAVEVAPGILWVRMPMPMALDHINIYLLRGDDGWTLIDTGLNTDTCTTTMPVWRAGCASASRFPCT